MIFDENGNEINSAAMTISPDAEKLFTLRIECRANYFLKAISETLGVSVFAKFAMLDAWQNILLAPLALSAFAGSTISVFCKISVAPDALETDEIVQIIVSL